MPRQPLTRRTYSTSNFTSEATTGPQPQTLVEIIRSKAQAWTAKELGGLLSMSPKHLLKLAKNQRIQSYRIGASVRFDPVDTAIWLQNRTVGG